MPFIQENKVRNYRKGNPAKKKHSRFSITIPRSIVAFMGWKKGDELVFKLSMGKVILDKKGVK